MELQGRSWELFEARVVKLQGCLSYGIDSALTVFVEFLQVLAEKRGVNLLDRLF